MKNISILELMIKDHTQLLRYLNDVEDNLESDSSILHQTFNTFQWNLEKHFFVEERAIFLSYNPRNPEKDYTFFSDLMDQHTEIQEIIEALRKNIQNKKSFSLDELKRLLVKHKTFEEKKIYPLIDQEMEEGEKGFIMDRINDIRL